MPPRRANPPNEVALLREQVEAVTQGLADMRTQQAEFFNRVARHFPDRDEMDNRHRADRHSDDASAKFDSDDDDTLTADNPFATLNRHDGRRPNANNRWESSFRVDIPEFMGSGTPDAFLDWIFAVEELLDFKEVPTNRRVALVATRLRGRASSWWHHLKTTRLRQGKSAINQWDKFRKYLEREFLPFNYDRLLYQKFQNLRQGMRTVDAYSTEFYELLTRLDNHETPDQLVSRYIGGLRVQFQDTLNLFCPTTVSEAHQQAVTLETQFNRRPSQGIYNGTDRRPTPPPLTASSDPPRVAGSTTSNQPRASGAATIGPRPPGTGRCFNCGDLGHRMSACPNPRSSRNFLADDLNENSLDTPPVFDEEPLEEFPETHLRGDVGALLVLRRAYLTPKSEGESDQRHCLFQSTCILDRVQFAQDWIHVLYLVIIMCVY